MNTQRVREYLKQFGKEDAVQEFEESSATVELAAQVLGVEPARIAKTISLQGQGCCILIVAAGDSKVHNAAFKQQFGVKAKLLAPEETEALTGYRVGGICPFANPRGQRYIWMNPCAGFKRYSLPAVPQILPLSLPAMS